MSENKLCAETMTQMFPVNFANFLKNTFFTEHLLETSSELTFSYQVFYSNFDNAIFIVSEV